MRKPKWSEYGFHLSRSSLLGIYGLLLLLLLLIAANALLPLLWASPKNTSENEALTQAWTQFLAKNKDSQNHVVTAKMPEVRLVAFDPNTISKEGLIALGLPMKTVYTWLHFREKGGHFYKKEDLQKLYTLSQNDYARIAPFARIPAQHPGSPQGTGAAVTHRFSQQVPEQNLLLPLNRAFYKDLAHHPYLRPYVKEILRLRSQLGRFSSVKQLKQIDLINEQKYRKIAPYLSI